MLFISVHMINIAKEIQLMHNILVQKLDLFGYVWPDLGFLLET
jgi:hypothetical protein